MDQIKKRMQIIILDDKLSLIIDHDNEQYFYGLTRFLVQMKTSKFAFEII